MAKGQGIREAKRSHFKTSEKLAMRCKSYDPGSTFLGLKVKTNKIAKTAVIAICLPSYLMLYRNTVDKFVSITVNFILVYNE